MYCSSCGNKLPEDARFCEKCGTPVHIGAENQHPVNNKVPNTSAGNPKAGNQGREWAETGTAAFQEFSEKVNTAADKLGLDEWQKITCMVAACSALLFVICITGTLSSWMAVLSGILLLIFCMGKKASDSKELVLAMSVFIIRYMIVDIRLLFGENIYYSADSIVMRIIVYAMVVIYWLAVTGQLHQKDSGMTGVLVLSAVTAAHSAVNIFFSFRYGFRSVLFSLGMAGFFACYVILIGMDWKTADYIKSVLGKKVLASSQPKASAEPVSEAPQPKAMEESISEALQPEVPAKPVLETSTSGVQVNLAQGTVSVQETQENPVPQQQVRFCLSCGNRLPSDAVFCEHCGTKIERQ